METITSRTNPLMRRIRKLRDDRKARRNEGLYLCDGVKMLEEAVKWNADVRTVILSEDLADTPVPAGARAVLVPADLMRSISPMEAPQGALFLVNAPALTPPEQLTKDRYLILDALQDPGNVGTLCRTLYALGGAGVILPRHNSAYLGPAAHRAAAGALERLPVARVTNLAHALDEAEEAGFSIYGAGCGPDAADAFEHAMQLPAVLVLGNEDKGLRPGVAKRCGRMLRIPLARKFDSLNVAQAGAILLGLAAMRRQG